MDEEKGLLSTLFDFSFTNFVTAKLIKLLFAIGILAAGIGGIGFIVRGFQAGAGWGILTLLVSPVVFLIYTLLVRVFLEIVIVVFRIAENVQAVASRPSGLAAAQPEQPAPHANPDDGAAGASSVIESDPAP